MRLRCIPDRWAEKWRVPRNRIDCPGNKGADRGHALYRVSKAFLLANGNQEANRPEPAVANSGLTFMLILQPVGYQRDLPIRLRLLHVGRSPAGIGLGTRLVHFEGAAAEILESSSWIA